MSDSENRLREALRARAPYFKASAALRDRITDAPRTAEWNFWSPQRLSMFAGALASLCALAIFLTLFFTLPSSQDQMLQDIISSHVRSIQVDHLTDVASSDQHTVKPWFTGKLDFSPPVIDLPEAGFALIGGRMDYVGQRNVAALVYKHKQHVINLTMWPQPGADVDQQASSNRGYQVVNWRQKGFAFWAVSDVEAAKLREFATALKTAAR
jgi:anti-sigma factor RsiW